MIKVADLLGKNVLCAYQFPLGSLKVCFITKQNKSAFLKVDFYGDSTWNIAAPTSVSFHMLYNPDGAIVNGKFQVGGDIENLYDGDSEDFVNLLIQIEDQLQISIDPIFYEAATTMKSWKRFKPSDMGLNIINVVP